jgi:hypothetical protein
VPPTNQTPTFSEQFIINERAGTIQKTSNFRMKNHPLEWKNHQSVPGTDWNKKRPYGGIFLVVPSVPPWLPL